MMSARLITGFIIIIFYLVFPRAEVNFRLFDTSASSVGIPDSIDLGSFSQFSNSDEEVFTLINNNFKKENLYFNLKDMNSGNQQKLSKDQLLKVLVEN